MATGKHAEGAAQRAAKVRLLVLDVDGVLTDGRIYYGNDGEELKAFDIKDGLGIKLLQRAGVAVAIITGRQSEIVARRARELGIEDLTQGREDKLQALDELCQRRGLALEQCAYMGDDLPDLAAIRRAGLGMSVADASPVVRAAADWLSTRNGGEGAVREACEFILGTLGERERLEAEFG
jgi:3-deoxy-D-manno-octulosonate 8-phosphate phosphatase (KDO 8-P phosphatase)